MKHTIIKTVIQIIVTLLSTIILIVFFIKLGELEEWIRPEVWGSHNLGNNLFLNDGEGYDRVIVFPKGGGIRGNTCYSGTAIIPAGNEPFFVIEAIADDYWIIVKAMNRHTKEMQYYIIDKSFNPVSVDAEEIINKHRYVFDDNPSFCVACEELDIELKFQKP